MVNDDQVQGQEGVSYKHNIVIHVPLLKKLTSDVDNLEAGEGEDGEGVQLGLVGTPHEQHLLLQSWQQRGNLILNPDKHRN